jgi:hypothetical protein
VLVEGINLGKYEAPYRGEQEAKTAGRSVRKYGQIRDSHPSTLTRLSFQRSRHPIRLYP